MARQKTGNERVNVYMQADVMRGLRFLAQRRGTSYSELIRVAARDFVIREVPKERDKIDA